MNQTHQLEVWNPMQLSHYLAAGLVFRTHSNMKLEPSVPQKFSLQIISEKSDVIYMQ